MHLSWPARSHSSSLSCRFWLQVSSFREKSTPMVALVVWADMGW